MASNESATLPINTIEIEGDLLWSQIFPDSITFPLPTFSNYLQLIGFLAILCYMAFNNYLASQRTKATLSKVDTATQKVAENQAAVLEVKETINGKMAELIKTKEELARTSAKLEMVSGITPKDAVLMSSQVGEVWLYLRNRAIAEALAKGYVTADGMKMTASNEVRRWYANMIPDLKEWYKNNVALDDAQLFMACHKKFGERLTAEICKPYGVFDGACVQLAIILAKDAVLQNGIPEIMPSA